MMRFLAMSLFHRNGRNHGHANHHGFDHRHHGHASQSLEDRVDQVASHLDLTTAQQRQLDELLSLAQRQRRGLRTALSPAGVQDLVASENFDRAAAREIFNARLDALRDAGPALIDAAADFFDGLDFDQQQALRFLLRSRLGRRAQ
ncbi:Spy/CpxP family protein refolding chaperone [Paucibacter sp. JuS9]|uniref:Spy/CpxP family protein refolding chaperone n=1 Tax=Paucibacter sp. JuS9 TaxID=3228748 RepID=UPI003757524F